MKNWKSTLFSLLFVAVYVYAIYDNKSVGVIDITGYIALWAMMFLMLRNEMTPKLIEKLIDVVASKVK